MHSNVSQVWERLGLRVRHCGMAEHSAMEFSIQHPDLSASLICPSTAAKIELQETICCIEVSAAVPSARRRQRTYDVDAAGYDGGFVHEQPDQMASHFGEPQTSKEKIEHLLKAAITVHMTGSTRHLPGFRTKHCSATSVLSKIAPAVFNANYVNVCVNIKKRNRRSKRIES